LKIYEYYEDTKRRYLITDLCWGGELYDELSLRGKFNEKEASIIIG